MSANNVKLEQVFRYVDQQQDRYIARLSDAVSIASVSGEPERRADVVRMVEWTKDLLQTLGATCELREIGYQTLPDGDHLDLPPVLLGILGTDPHKKTLCVYGHLDVQPAKKSDGWATEPFELVEKDGKLFGRGSTDDKGPVLAWINAIEAFQATGAEMPINIKFVFEGMEESGSEGLNDLLATLKDNWLKDVDYTCISDNYWLGKSKPCITYGLRGLSYYFVEVAGTDMDLHSGSFGGSVHEPMNDLVWLMSQLIDVRGTILIPGIKEMVAPLTPEEEGLYDTIEFDVETFRKDIGAPKLTHDTAKDVLLHRWRYPSLSIHGVEGAFSGTGAKTVIPRKVIVKFSIRLVPNIDPKHCDQLVIKYLNELYSKRGSPNKLTVSTGHEPGLPWVADFKHPHYQAGARAIKTVFGVEPDFTREGCSIPVTLTFQELTGKNVMLLPIGSSDDMAHSQNEKLNITNYMKGTKLLGAYFYEIAAL
uniref:Peptidase M20 dimerisation domain-containing protein n=1 Tax=Plectus sambesii TaxID=2011161 RepID=A0A914V2D2_9BILA